MALLSLQFREETTPAEAEIKSFHLFNHNFCTWKFPKPKGGMTGILWDSVISWCNFPIKFVLVAYTFSQLSGKKLVCKIPSAFYGKRGQKYFPCEQWKRNLDLFFSLLERAQTSLSLYYLENLGRERHGNDALQGGCLAKKSWSIVGFLSKKLSFVVIYTETPQQFPPQSVSWEHQCKPARISFPALKATLPS